MSKRILIIGSGKDVLFKKRAKYFDKLKFDDIIIIKYQINFLEKYKDYIGNPTVLVAPSLEWKKYKYYHTL